MRVLQLVAADRWTGAAATALQLAEALRAAGVDCRFAFRPGRGLEERLRGRDWCHPMLVKERGPLELLHAVRRVRALCDGMDVVHCHLPHDHLLARLALAGRGEGTGDRGQVGGEREDGRAGGGQGAGRGPWPPLLVRSVRHPGHIAPHLYHRWLFRRTRGVGLANSTMAPPASRVGLLAGVATAVLPVALEAAFFGPLDRQGTRARLGVPDGAFVAGTIGKIDGTRGHAELIRALACAPGVWGVVVGKGPAVGELQELARELGVAGRLVWAGYVEEGREHIYAAMDLFVFPAAGSDWGHRAIAEASACGLPTLAVDLPGVGDLVVPGLSGELFAEGDVAALGRLLAGWGADPGRCRAAGRFAAERARRIWTPPALAAAALGLYRAAAPPAAHSPGR